MTAAEKLLRPATAAKRACPIHCVAPDGMASRLKDLPRATSTWVKANGYKAAAGTSLAVPGDDGSIACVLFGLGGGDKPLDPFAPGALASTLPEGDYAFDASVPDATAASLAWLLDAYRFTAYGKPPAPAARLACPKGVDRDEILRIAGGVTLARDLVNTPANDMGPDQLEQAARALARRHKARITVTKGARLEKEFPLIDAVGRASARQPRLIDFVWGPARAPKVTLVGKGVCFDTGGLDLKPSSAMLLMKKDMGGAANVLGLADMIMSAGLKVRLRVLVPAVENSVSGNAFRPGDVLMSRKGLAVAIGNTDAEGRLVLADALDLADADQPDLLIDMATLTGAARVAVGPDLAPFYTADDDLAAAIAARADAVNDPVWRMPLWRPYGRYIESKIGDIDNAGSGAGFAGSITAALFLASFVEKAKSWAHFDIFAWTPAALSGKPFGGEAQAIRALYALLAERYG